MIDTQYPSVSIYQAHFESESVVHINKKCHSNEQIHLKANSRECNRFTCSANNINNYYNSYYQPTTEMNDSSDFSSKQIIYSNMNSSSTKRVNDSCIDNNYSYKEESQSDELSMDESSTSSADSSSLDSQNGLSYYLLPLVNKHSNATEIENMMMSGCEQPKVNRGGRKQVKQGTTKRNARERNRVRFINQCFEILREHIPEDFVSAIVGAGGSSLNINEKRNRKLSKVETLKYAAMYIRQLMDLLKCSYEQESSRSNELYYNNQLVSGAVISPTTVAACVRVSPSSPYLTSVQYKPNENETTKKTTSLNASTLINSNMKNTNGNNISFNNININIYDNRQQLIGEILSPALSSCSSASSSSSCSSSSSSVSSVSSLSSCTTSTLLAHGSSFGLSNQPIYSSCNMSQSFMSTNSMNSLNANMAYVGVDRHQSNNRFQDYNLKW
jgi:hypothetical protein